MAKAVRTGLVLAWPLTLAACGASASITTGASQALSAQVQRITADARTGDMAQARTDLAQLRTMVGSYGRAGQLSAAKSSAITAAASVVLTQIEATTTTAPAPATVAPPSTGSSGDSHHAGHKQGGDG
ncbi:MAG TPA: hypothetical protein VNF50_00515 [Acidimicrobiales bacterium]|nr:hypothetical protein [Acidimicrobiales bacterium]